MRAAGEATRERIPRPPRKSSPGTVFAGARIQPRVSAEATASKERRMPTPQQGVPLRRGRRQLLSDVTAETELRGDDLPGYTGGSSTATCGNPTTAASATGWILRTGDDSADADAQTKILQSKIDEIRRGRAPAQSTPPGIRSNS